MADASSILDGLAWAGMTEPARIARITAQLTRERHGSSPITQTRIKDAIRATVPPYGRGKAIFEAIYGAGSAGELQRQQEIYSGRQRMQNGWEREVSYLSELSTRLNLAYAAAFDRPPFREYKPFPGHWSEHDAAAEWNKQERTRPRGDICFALTHQDGYVVCLVRDDRIHVATRLKRGPIVRTFLRDTNAEDLTQAIVSLGGPRVRAALSKGKRVKTDWVGRRSFIHHDGSDHHSPKIEEIPWEAVVYEQQENREQPAWGPRTVTVNVLIHGEQITRETE